MCNIISEDLLINLRELVRPYLKEKRYIHTLGVEEEAAALGKIYLPDKINKLRVSALLHDITKKLNKEEQINLCHKYEIPVTDRLLSSPKLFHSITASNLIKDNFPDYYDKEIELGVRWHTTGHDKMTMFEAIVYLADYIEKNRTFADCIELRNYFYNNLNECNTENDRLIVFKNTMIRSFDLTIKNLIEEENPLDTDTIEARNYFLNDFEVL